MVRMSRILFPYYRRKLILKIFKRFLIAKINKFILNFMKKTLVLLYFQFGK